MKKDKLLLFIIIILAAFLRFYKLGLIPPSLDWDETAHGYNAYSILKTGRDEYGYLFPLSFRSFDDYKPPLYTYLVVPAVAVFGLTDFAVRFPSAAIGVLAVLFTYLMVYELFKNRTIALLSSLFLAISPWHLQFSRVAFETNSAIFFSVLGTWAFLKGVNSQAKKIRFWMTTAAIAFGLNLFMYHNARVFIPVFSLALLIPFRKFLIMNKKFLIIPAIISLAFIALLIPIIFSISGQLRFKGTAIFFDQSPVFKSAELIEQDQKSNQELIGRIFHNRRLVYIPILIDNYLSHLKPSFLFFTADMERHHAPQMGLLYLWDLPFILSGIYFLVSRKLPGYSKAIIFWWFLVSPVASSVTWGVPHSLRSEIYLPTFQIFTALGVYYLFKLVRFKKLFIALTSLALFANFVFYLHQYYLHMSEEFSKFWLYGRKEAALYSESIKSDYDRVVVSTSLEQPHEFWLYYLKYDPVKYLKEGGTVSGGFLEDRNKFDKYFFKPIDYENQKLEAKTLFVGTPKDFPQGINILKQTNYLNGEPAIYVVGEN